MKQEKHRPETNEQKPRESSTEGKHAGALKPFVAPVVAPNGRIDTITGFTF